MCLEIDFIVLGGSEDSGCWVCVYLANNPSCSMLVRGEELLETLDFAVDLFYVRNQHKAQIPNG